MPVCRFNGPLQRANSDLEDRVRERTRRLAESLAAEQRLRLELRTVTDTARIGLVMVDADHRQRYAHQPYKDILGLPELDPVGLRVADMLPAAYDSQIRPRLDRSLGGEPVQYQLTLPPLSPDAPNRNYFVNYSPVATDGERLVVVAIAEVSARRQREATATRLASIVESSNDAIIGKDLDGIITSWKSVPTKKRSGAAAGPAWRSRRRLGSTRSIRRNGRHALSLFAAHHTDIRVVLTDLMMPVLDGAETVRLLRREAPELEVVVMTGVLTPAARTELTAPGVKHFMMKAISPGRPRPHAERRPEGPTLDRAADPRCTAENKNRRRVERPAV